MNDRDALRVRGRALEEEWADRRARAAVARLSQRMDEEQERRRLAERTGIDSPELLRRVRALGLDADSVDLLFLVPLVGMAGADGAVSYAERALVKELARESGLERGTRAWALLDGWLIEPPDGETLDGMLALLEELLAAMPCERADALRGRIVNALERIGRASGGVWGIGALSWAEREFAARMGDRMQYSCETPERAHDR